MASPEVADAPGPARQLNIGGMPAAPTALLLITLVTAILIAADSLYTIGVMRAALLQGGFSSGLVSAVSVLLALVSVLLALPLVRAFLRWRDVRRAVARGDVVAARVSRSEARNQCWIAIGYAFAQFMIVLVFQFLLANNQAVAKTFFFVPLMAQTFPLVLKAFWINIEIFR